MSKAAAINQTKAVHAFTRETLVQGQPVEREFLEIHGQTYTLNDGPVSIVSLEDDWYEDVRDPEAVLETLKRESKFKPDLFTFWQRYPEVEPRFSYLMEWEEIAVIPIQSYDHWWNKQIKSRTRNLIRKSEKEGVEIRETAYDDDFVRGMTQIFNESPVRQGRKFWHYGKTFQTVKQQFSRFIHREYMIGAYYKGEMIGLMMLANTGRFALTGQIISSLKHRDKSPNNALIAKAVEICDKRQLGHFCYLFWSDDSLSEFKRRCGFEKVRVPRYFVPLTAKGKLAIKCGAHRGWKEMIPKGIKPALKRLRRMWHGIKEE